MQCLSDSLPSFPDAFFPSARLQSPTSLQWYLEVYPQLEAARKPLEVLQNPGDTIFLPAGGWPNGKCSCRRRL